MMRGFPSLAVGGDSLGARGETLRRTEPAMLDAAVGHRKAPREQIGHV